MLSLFFSNLLNRIQRETQRETLGLDLSPGAHHYRAYVGPPQDYDLVAAMTFNLLSTLGLRQHHTLLDVGCGSLRVGRLLIPYLNTGNYTGIEPNKWLVAEGIQRETGQDQIHIKKPKFHFCDSAEPLPPDEWYDFAVAQSIFSHCGPDLVERWLADISSRLRDSGVLIATFLIGEQDCNSTGWIYPACVSYKLETMAGFARNAGFKFLLLDWKHPRQWWALYAKPKFDVTWFQDNDLMWNTWFEFAPK
jgi:SAM-dependent methyltransferase